MTISTPQSIEQALTISAPGQHLLCDPEAVDTLVDHVLANHQRQVKNQAISLLVGPEGGWSPEEVTTAMQHGAIKIKFGSRVLRTETAGLAMVAAISALLGW
jgi:16S rRNA (uracil1498-N3)-methyltransferase